MIENIPLSLNLTILIEDMRRDKNRNERNLKMTLNFLIQPAPLPFSSTPLPNNSTHPQNNLKYGPAQKIEEYSSQSLHSPLYSESSFRLVIRDGIF